MVYVSCKTYNQRQYIKDALDGFCMQKTEYPFVCAIFDDASTDGEVDVIRQYLVDNFNLNDNSVMREEETDDNIKIFAQHKDNKNCFFIVVLLKYNHYRLKKNKEQYVSEWLDNSRYIAICEGDDYWSVPDKLQKQVDFLSNNPDYSLCYGQCRYLEVKTQTFASQLEGGSCDTFESLMKINTIPTPTVLYRREIEVAYHKEIKPAIRGWLMGDYPMWLYMAHEGKVKFMNEEFAIYRVLNESASHSNDEDKSERFVYSTYDIVRFYSEHFNRPELFNANDIYKLLFNHAFKYGNRERAVKYYKQINNPSLKIRKKMFIIKIGFLYNLMKGRYFYSIK